MSSAGEPRAIRRIGQVTPDADFTSRLMWRRCSAATLLLVALLSACRTDLSSAETPAYAGVALPAVPETLAELDRFELDVGKRPGIVMYYRGWASHEFEPELAESIRVRGSQPMITWEPWDATKGVDQPDYRLARILDGSHDPYIRRWADAVRNWGHPLLLRFAHEMNGDWYPWAESVNGNLIGQYAAAWRHVRRIFDDAGAANVSWVWSPNVIYSGSTPLARLFPGDDEVDWVAADGYNGGKALNRGGWRTFDQLFRPTLAQLRTLSDKPLMVAEVGSAEAGGDKAAWIRDFFTELRRHGDIRAFVWFNWNKETDWRVQSSERARAAYAAGVAAPRYIG